MIKDKPKEYAILVNLDDDGLIINYCIYTSDEENSVYVPCSEYIRASVLSGARFVIHIHNHTSQEYDFFSLGDIEFYRELVETFWDFDITLFTSYLVMPNGDILEYDQELLNAYKSLKVHKASKGKYERAEKDGVDMKEINKYGSILDNIQECIEGEKEKISRLECEVKKKLK